MIKNKNDYKRYIKLEEDNYKESYPNLTTELKRIMKFQKLYRKLEYYTNCHKNNLITKYLQHKYDKLSIKYGFHIPINTIEEGLCIIHTGPIYINNNVKIGKNLRIHPMTTIGKTIGTDHSSPILGNNIWIGPGARLYGNITIGNNTVIGANSTVGKSFKGNCTIAGSPAKTINNKTYKDYFK